MMHYKFNLGDPVLIFRGMGLYYGPYTIHTVVKVDKHTFAYNTHAAIRFSRKTGVSLNGAEKVFHIIKDWEVVKAILNCRRRDAYRDIETDTHVHITNLQKDINTSSEKIQERLENEYIYASSSGLSYKYVDAQYSQLLEDLSRVYKDHIKQYIRKRYVTTEYYEFLTNLIQPEQPDTELVVGLLIDNGGDLTFKAAASLQKVQDLEFLTDGYENLDNLQMFVEYVPNGALDDLAMSVALGLGKAAAYRIFTFNNRFKINLK